MSIISTGIIYCADCLYNPVSQRLVAMTVLGLILECEEVSSEIKMLMSNIHFSMN